ncbi:MAG: GSCFA domain-containing protein [Proteobacteria bacterium]|nr:GSCFA domain-containing protein [Pseudomonadota bacterium]
MDNPGTNAELVLKRAGKNPHSKWPSWEKSKNRLIPFCSPVHEAKFKISSDAVFFTIGSCFARNLEVHLDKFGIKNISHTPPPGLRNGVWRNDYLNKYTPYGIATEIRMALDPDFNPPVSDLLITDGENFYDPHTNLPHTMGPQDDVLARRENINKYFSEIQNADVVVITLGQIETWYDSKTDLHYDMVLPRPLIKAYPERFFLRIPRYSEYLRVMEEAVSLILSTGKEKKVVITTSPVPASRTFSGRDALVSYSHTKSLLRTLAQELADNDDRVDYFPSYEIVTLSEREKVFNSDLIHVEDGIVARIMQQFFISFFDLDITDFSEPRACRIQGSLLRSESHFKEAFAFLSEVIESHGNDEILLRELAFVSGRVDELEKQVSILERLDTLTHPGEPPIDYKDISHQDRNIQRAWDLLNAKEYVEASARLNAAFAFHSDAFSTVKYNQFYLNVLMCLSKLRRQHYCNYIELDKQTEALNALLKPDQDEELRAKINELLTQFNTGNFDGGEDSLKLCLIKYLPVLAAPSSQDLRVAIMEISKTFSDPGLHYTIDQINNAVFPFEFIKLEAFYQDEEDA